MHCNPQYVVIGGRIVAPPIARVQVDVEARHVDWRLQRIHFAIIFPQQDTHRTLRWNLVMRNDAVIRFTQFKRRWERNP
ncbi:hypothetical protein GCM10027093_26480 [Paraburkholderia jirisanensis]